MNAADQVRGIALSVLRDAVRNVRALVEAADEIDRKEFNPAMLDQIVADLVREGLLAPAREQKSAIATVSLETAARIIGKERSTIRRMVIKDPALGWKVGPHWRISRDRLEIYRPR